MPNVTVTLDDAEQLQLEEIVIDGDQKAALEFLRRTIKAKIDRHRKSHCRPVFEGPSSVPQ
ncbi:MAG TPA: hypothetical protein VMY87_09470 [Armatimonadota bacterium]|nr:hypothetical protein [Armatimonadota bacterium]